MNIDRTVCIVHKNCAQKQSINTEFIQYDNPFLDVREGTQIQSISRFVNGVVVCCIAHTGRKLIKVCTQKVGFPDDMFVYLMQILSNEICVSTTAVGANQLKIPKTSSFLKSK